MINRGPSDRAVSPAIATLLLVAVVLVLGAAVGAQLLGITEKIGGPTAEATFEYDESPVGVEMTPEQIGQDVTVEINGKPVETFDTDDAGNGKIIPTSPGDELTVVAADDSRSVLVSKTIDDRDEIGDFIAHYTFDEGSGSTVEDRSGNGNDGEREGGTNWVDDSAGTGLNFDGSTGTHVDMGDLTVDGPESVDEITVAIKYQHDGGSDIQNLIEHEKSDFAWFMETDGKFDDPHQMEFNVGWSESPSGSITTGDVSAGETQVLVGTYDGNEMVFYRNGNRIGSRTFERDVGLGEIKVGADSEPDAVGQNLDGRIYEVRLYYAAFDQSGADAVTNAME